MSRVKRNSQLSIVLSFWLFVVGFFVSPFVDALGGGQREVSQAEKEEIVEKFSELQKVIHSLCAAVIQEKHLAVLKKKVHIEGAVEMARPNMLRWEVAKPEKSITVINGETMTVYYPDAKEAQVYTLSENFIARNTMSFFITAMSGDLHEMEKRFSVSVFRNGGEIVFKLVPLSGIVSRYLSNIIVSYDETTGLPKGIEVTTPGSDRTITTLADIRINSEFRPETFKIKLPENVRITNKDEEQVTH
jgi:outer membrane lipoprotein-sorting protein